MMPTTSRGVPAVTMALLLAWTVWLAARANPDLIPAREETWGLAVGIGLLFGASRVGGQPWTGPLSQLWRWVSTFGLGWFVIYGGAVLWAVAHGGAMAPFLRPLYWLVGWLQGVAAETGVQASPLHVLVGLMVVPLAVMLAGRSLSAARGMAAVLTGIALVGAVWTAALHDNDIAEARGSLSLLALGVGLVFGWTLIGPRLGTGFWNSALYALSAMIYSGVAYFALVAAWTGWQGLGRNGFRSPADFVAAVTDSFVDNIAYMTDIRILLAAAIGMLIAGIISEYCSMIWN